MLSVSENPTDSVTVQSEKLFLCILYLCFCITLFSGNATLVVLPCSHKSGLEVMFVN